MEKKLTSVLKDKRTIAAIIGGGLAAAVATFGLYKYYWVPKVQKKRRLTFAMAIKESDPKDEQIVITDLENLFEKLRKLKKDGINELCIISDYDQTISPSDFNGKPCPATFAILRNPEVVGEKVTQVMRVLFEKYHPIETNPNLSVEEKLKPLSEWIEQVSHCLRDGNVSGKTLEEAFAASNTAVRRGFAKMFKELIKGKIPYYIVSGGISDFIDLVFDNIDPAWSTSGTVRVNANKFLLDEEFQMKGLALPHIHTLMKSGFLDSKKEKFRKNVILYGDILTDTLMASRVDAEMILNIGFLNRNASENIGAYKARYDIVICNDGSYDLPNDILAYLQGSMSEEELFNIIRTHDTASSALHRQ